MSVIWCGPDNSKAFLIRAVPAIDIVPKVPSYIIPLGPQPDDSRPAVLRACASGRVSVVRFILQTMTELFRLGESARAADRRAREWVSRLDTQERVGSRHHIVPRVLLERFASARGQLRVRARADGKPSTRSIDDLAVSDFYTAVSDGGVLDSSLESLFSQIEGQFATIMRVHLDGRAFRRPAPFTDDERATLDCFVGAQAVRGMRVRRSFEVMTDYTMKMLNQNVLSDEDMRTSEFVSHPNEHLKAFGQLAERAELALRARATTLMWLDQPLLLIGDEPVLVVRGDDTGGFANAEAIMLPVSPRTVLVYGPPRDQLMLNEMKLTGEEALSFADETNQLMIESAIDWVAANPDHISFESTPFSTPGPIVHVSDSGSAAADRINSTPAHRPTRRVRADDVLKVGQVHRPPQHRGDIDSGTGV